MYLSFKDAQPQNRQMGCASHVNVAAQATYLRAAALMFLIIHKCRHGLHAVAGVKRLLIFKHYVHYGPRSSW